MDEKISGGMGSMCGCCTGPWAILVTIVMIVAVPLLFIWALNSLFRLELTYTVYHWLAALILVAVVGGKGWKPFAMHSWCACAFMHKK